MNYKIILCDYDGTLFYNTVSDRNLQAIKEFEKRGGKFVISTGRSLPSILPIAKKLGLNGYIMSYNGSSLYDIEKEKEIINISVKNADAVKISKQMEIDGIFSQIYVDDEIYAKMPCYYTIRYEYQTGLKIRYTGINTSDFLIETKKDTMKLLAYADVTKTEMMSKKYNYMFGDTDTFVFSQPHLFECIDNRAGKGKMAISFCEITKIPLSEVIAIGDSQNDKSMLSCAGLKVAMGNAVDELKSVANYITDTASNDGVAKVIEKFCLN